MMLFSTHALSILVLGGLSAGVRARSLKDHEKRLLGNPYDISVLQGLEFHYVSSPRLSNGAEAIYLLAGWVIESVWASPVAKITKPAISQRDPRYPSLEVDVSAARVGVFTTAQLGWAAITMWDYALKQTTISQKLGLNMNSIQVFNSRGFSHLANLKLIDTASSQSADSLSITNSTTYSTTNSTFLSSSPVPQPGLFGPSVLSSDPIWIDFINFGIPFLQSTYLRHYLNILTRLVLPNAADRPVRQVYAEGQVFSHTVGHTTMRMTIVNNIQNGQAVAFGAFSLALKTMLLTPPVHDDPKSFQASIYILGARGVKDLGGPFLSIELNGVGNLSPINGSAVQVVDNSTDVVLPAVSNGAAAVGTS